jgi:hypothetical protein
MQGRVSSKNMRRFLGLYLLILFLGCGCAARSQQGLPYQSLSGIGVQGKILQPDILAAGGKVLIVPFSAGVYTAASEELDRASLVMMRGMIDGLNDASGRFQVLDLVRGDGTQPDIVITGNIERFEVRKNWMRYFGRSRERLIEFHARVVDQRGELLAVFSYVLKTRYQDMTQTDFLLKAGYDAGLFLRQR